MGGYETPRRLVPTPPSASNEPSSGGKTGIFRDFDFFTASDGAVLLPSAPLRSKTAPSLSRLRMCSNLSLAPIIYQVSRMHRLFSSLFQAIGILSVGLFVRYR